MKNYRDALSRFAATDLGGGAEDHPQKASAEEVLRKDILDVMRSDTKYFNLCVAILIVLFIGSILVVLINLNHPATITAIFAATGISYGYLLNQITGLWREKSHAEVAYTLARNLPPQDLKAVISVLLAKGN